MTAKSLNQEDKGWIRGGLKVHSHGGPLSAIGPRGEGDRKGAGGESQKCDRQKRALGIKNSTGSMYSVLWESQKKRKSNKKKIKSLPRAGKPVKRRPIH